MKKVLIPPNTTLYESEYGYYNFQYPSNRIACHKNYLYQTLITEDLQWVGSKTYKAVLLNDKDSKEIGHKEVWIKL